MQNTRIGLLALIAQAQYHITHDRAPFRWYHQRDRALVALTQIRGR